MVHITAAAAAVLYLGAYALLGLLHVRRPDLSVVLNAVSEYGVGSSASLFRIYGTTGSAAAAMLAIAFYLSSDIPSSANIAFFLTLMVAARIGLSVWPTDTAGKPRSSTGRIHLLFAIASFAFTYMAVTRIADALPSIDHLPQYAWIWSPFRWAIAASLATTVAAMTRPLRPVFGLAERAFLLLTPLFFLAASLWLATR